MNLNIGSNIRKNPSYELVLQLRDNDGNSIGQTKSISTDDSVKLHQFWLRHTGTNKKKKKKDQGVASKTYEIMEGLKEVETYTKIIRAKRKLED